MRAFWRTRPGPGVGRCRRSDEPVAEGLGAGAVPRWRAPSGRAPTITAVSVEPLLVASTLTVSPFCSEVMPPERAATRVVEAMT